MLAVAEVELAKGQSLLEETAVEETLVCQLVEVEEMLGPMLLQTVAAAVVEHLQETLAELEEMVDLEL
jgi:hypothetical protein